MRLRARFTLALSGLSLVVLAVTGALVLVAEDRYVLRKAREDQYWSVEALARACSALARSNNEELARYAFEVVRSSDVAYAGFFSPAGRPLRMLVGKPPAQGPPTALLASALRGDGPVADLDASGSPGLAAFARPVLAGGEPLGLAVIAYEPRVLRERRLRVLRNNAWRFAGIALAAMLLSSIFSAWLGAMLSRPIRELAEGAREVGAGNLTHRIPAGSSDELGELAGEFNRMADRLGELDRLKEEFLASVTHELRSPVTAIAGFADLLLGGSGGALSERQRDWVESARRSAKRLSRMVNNVLDMAKLEAGRVEFAPEALPIGEVAREEADALMPLADERRVSLSVEDGESRPAYADLDAVRQVLTNLIGNAIKFTPEGGRVLVQTGDEGDGAVVVRVADTGPGVPPESLPRLFSKFFQVGDTNRRAKAHGTGLGLAISKGLVEGQGGRIWAENGAKGGAVFAFTLPAKRDQPGP